MSQKRQEARDGLRAENDYRVNLKAELEIRHLHEKIDHLLTKQWERLAEIQQIQLELLQELTARRPGSAWAALPQVLLGEHRRLAPVTGERRTHQHGAGSIALVVLGKW